MISKAFIWYPGHSNGIFISKQVNECAGKADKDYSHLSGKTIEAVFKYLNIFFQKSNVAFQLANL